MSISMRSRFERRTDGGEFTRGRWEVAWDLIFGVLRWMARHARNAYTVFGLFLLAGAGVTVTFTYAFAKLAGHVRSGKTQRFDEAVMRFLGEHRSHLFEATMIEITALGTGVVVTMVVLVAGLFLWLNHHKHSAILLGVATVGGIGLNNLLKIGFDRPRPTVFEWSTHAASSSFPSGHAMSAAIVYGTVAYLAARLQRERISRVVTMIVAAILVVLICLSRMYLGVHYPSDVLAGVIVGFAWAGFCMAMLEATQLYAKRNAPQMLEEEHPAAAPATPPGAKAAAKAAEATASPPGEPPGKTDPSLRSG